MSKELTPAMRRSVLIAALRDEKLWPSEFKWAFNHCDHCAMGLYFGMMNVPAPSGGTHAHKEAIGEVLGLSDRQVTEVFDTPAYAPTNELWFDTVDEAYLAVTPAMVADRLEAIHREIGE